MVAEQHPTSTRLHPDATSTPARPMSGFAVSSLVWSLVGLATFGVAAVGGAICGHLALRETRAGTHRGHRVAVAGLVISWVQIVGWLLAGLVVLVIVLVRAANL